MFEAHHHLLSELLRERGLLDAEQLEVAAARHAVSGCGVAVVALEHGWIERTQLLQTVADHLGYDFASTVPAQLPGEGLALVGAERARTYGVAPMEVEPTCVTLLAADPFNPRVVEDLTFAFGREVRLVVADPAQVEALIERHYGRDEMSWEDALAGIEEIGADFGSEDDAVSTQSLQDLAAQAPLVRLVNIVLAQAIRARASDIHFEPFEREYRIRYRVDGTLYEVAPPPRNLAAPIASRLKVFANLNIAERRVPQDGRLRLTLAGHPVDLRISTLPTQAGESVVLRVLDQAQRRLAFDELGLPPPVLAGLRQAIARPHGMIVVTGPTGSGKTTTLYSLLQVLNTTERKLLAAEDPVEYDVEGVMQIPVQPTIGLGFARVLRTVLRHDPDVIMIGEIRDLETAQIAVQAALTGHLVLATLHTNDAAGAVTRLLDLGIEPFLVAATLDAVLAQRLVRTVCPKCSEETVPTAEQLQAIGMAAEMAAEARFRRGRGCVHCGLSEYRGRMGIFEWMPVDPALRERIAEKASTQELRALAKRGGMIPLRESAITALQDGRTTLDEVLQHT